MTIQVRVVTGPHRAKVERTGHDAATIGPDADTTFSAYPGCDIKISEVDTDSGTATTQGGGGGHGNLPT